MRPFPTAEQVREAGRIDLDRSRRAQLRATGGAAEPVVWRVLGFAFTWVLPAVPAAAGALGADVRSRWWSGLLGLWAVVAALAREDSIARRTPFEALRFDHPGALLVARFRRQLPWILWLGGCVAMLRVAQLVQTDARGVPVLALSAVVLTLAPAHILAARVRFIAAEGLPSGPPWRWYGVVGAFVLAIAAAVAASVGVLSLFDDIMLVAIFVAARGPGVGIWCRRPGRCALAALEFGWMAGAGAVACGKIESPGAGVPWAALATLGFMAAYAMVATPWLIVWSARQRPVLDADTQKAAAARARGPAASSPDVGAETDARPLRRVRPGTGPWRTGWRIRVRKAAESLTTGRWWSRAFAAFVVAPIAVLWHARSVGCTILALCAAQERGVQERLLALLAAGFAAFAAPAFTPPFRRTRLYLLGMDLRDVERMRLHHLATHGAAPPLVAGALLLLLLGFPALSVATYLTMLACFALRAGWIGMGRLPWVRPAAALALTGSWAALLRGAIPADSHWIVAAAGAATVAGVSGVWIRLAGTPERALRDEMRPA